MSRDNTDRRTFLKVSGGTGLALTTGIAGCVGGEDADTPSPEPEGNGGSGDSGDGTPTGESEPRTAEVGFAHYPVIAHGLPLLVGIEKGFFDDHGLDFGPDQIISTGGGGAAIRTMQASNIPIGMQPPGTVAKAYHAGALFHIVGLATAIPDVDWQTRADSDIETIQDVETIAVTAPGSATETQAVLSVENADGISLDDVEIIHAGGLGEAISAFMEGVADVGMNTNPISTRMIEAGESRRVWHTRDYAPDYTEDVLLMNGKFMDDNPELGRDWLRAWIDAAFWIHDNVEEAGRMWANAADFEEDIAIKGLKDTQPEKFYQVEVRKGIIDNVERALRFDGTLREGQQLDKQGLVRDELLPEEHQADWVER